MKEVDIKYLTNTDNTISYISEATKALPVARTANFFTQIRKILGDCDKIRRRILEIMDNYLDNENEKRMNCLKRKLLHI